mmetsp:Transcript_27396/g.63275  ORF Transcript_27396/g.63275 Transcript_27396/m.63275 type:complete len:122 (+) Transcript_27396:390-755(+)
MTPRAHHPGVDGRDIPSGREETIPPRRQESSDVSGGCKEAARISPRGYKASGIKSRWLETADISSRRQEACTRLSSGRKQAANSHLARRYRSGRDDYAVSHKGAKRTVATKVAGCRRLPAM